jgi:hypothetical protein
MEHITKILKRLLPKEIPKPMGRWRNEYCNVKINQKIDLSNEDHCGPCGQYILSKTDLKIKENNNSHSQTDKTT